MRVARPIGLNPERRRQLELQARGRTVPVRVALRGKHATDHIVIYLPKGPSILNNWTNSNGSPKDISIP
jgi:hypothetical protein